MSKAQEPRFVCDWSAPSSPLPHFWEHTVGSGHATLALRADWQRQLARCRRELGFKHVRFHGLLNDDMSTLVRAEGKRVQSFFNADQICDFLLSIGMRPFVELSFMPTALSRGSKTVFHYRGNVTPPRVFEQWEALIHGLTRHWADRYGVAEVGRWLFEVWNEPNLAAFWTGNRADYFRLYQHAARAIKKVHPSFRVGGPATANNAWIREFLGFCKAKRVPVDFVSTHHYPTDAFGTPGDDTIAKLALSKRSVLQTQARKARRDAGRKPLYYTEWSSSSDPSDELHDEPYAAAFIVKTVMEARGLVEGYSYWTFSDIFEENAFSSHPFHGGFGLLNIHGIPKPAYRAFELLHRQGDQMLPVQGKHATADVWVARGKKSATFLVTNWALPEHPIQTEVLRLELRGARQVATAYVERIDEENANPRRAWEKMGRPDSLSPREVEALEMASGLIKRPISFQRERGAIVFQLPMPPQSTALLTVELS